MTRPGDSAAVLQFGAGNFLRAFVDLIIEQCNRTPASVGKVVLVQTTGTNRVEALNRAGRKYHVALQGVLNGEVVDRTESVGCIDRALSSESDWREILEFAREPSLRWIVSNSTEAGFALDPSDAVPSADSPPASFPAKLLAVLLARHKAGAPAPTVLPCELIEHNGTRLRDLVLEQAGRWSVSPEAREWLRDSCRWVDTLVDRIVPGPPMAHALLGIDPLLLSAEPYALWALRSAHPILEHPDVVHATDLAPFHLKKVRILNGLHTALVARAMPIGVETVAECLDHPVVGPWMHSVLFDEIVPVLEGRVDDPAGYARTTLDRFRNPFLRHKLASIALNHEAKVATRLLPTISEYEARFGKKPPLLSQILQP